MGCWEEGATIEKVMTEFADSYEVNMFVHATCFLEEGCDSFKVFQHTGFGLFSLEHRTIQANGLVCH